MNNKSYFIFAALSILIAAIIPLSAKAATIGGRFYPVGEPVQKAVNHLPQPIDNLVGHHNSKVKIIFSDIDGTLLPFNKVTKKVDFPPAINKAVMKLHEANIPLILTTGRSYREARDVAHKVGNDNTYLVAHQGAQIINPKGEIIYQDNIKPNDVYKILKKIETFGKSKKMQFDVVVFTEKDTYATHQVELPANWEDITIIESFDELKGANICKITIADSNLQKLRLIQEYLKKNFPNYNVVLSSDFYCDLSSKTATKGNAVLKLSQILGLNLKNSAAFGDAENDVSMLSLVKAKGGVAVSMGNAMAVTKYNSNYVTSSVYSMGFAKAVDKILLNNAKLDIKSIKSSK